ncbi:hypothetical protein SS37A_20740 [Methylocystis iwaonis]|uniref:Uncharacterized protein n=1 Tax=Methylocystis iwaonis TaxID=2885079 RepID=A0ABM8E9A1_9HYPH|nr:hypothetical protein SS37A_20740 [Methylocystis iwaonis]
MAAGKNGDERLLHHLVLSEDDGADGGAGAPDMIQRPLSRFGDGGFERRNID